MNKPLVRAFLLLTLFGALAACAQLDPRWAEPRRVADLPPEEAGPPPPPPPISRTVELGLPTEDDERESVETVIQRGTGTFIAPPGPPVQATVRTDASGAVTLNVVDAELREVVRLVLQDALGVNYVVDPAVGGRITVQTMRPVPPDDLLTVLDGVLRMNGAALVRGDDVYQIVPIDQAIGSGPIVGSGPLPEAGSQGFGVRVVPLRYVSANEMAPLLEPFAPSGGAIQVDPARNLLLLAGLPEQLRTLSDLVTMFDVDWLQGTSFGLFPLENAPAVTMVEELDQIFSVLEGGPLAGLLRFVPIERLNAILVVSSQPDYLDQVSTWVERLDRIGDGEEPRVFVYAVQNARATDLSAVLSEMFDARSSTVEGSSLLAPGEEAIDLQGGFQFGAGEEGVVGEETGGTGAAIRAAAGPGQAVAQATGPEDADIRIIADDTSNSLVVRASPREYKKIREALDELDILPLQVLIEATIAEVTLNDELRFGVEWFISSGDFDITFNPGGLAAANGFSAFLDTGDVRILLQALDEVTDVDIISSPQLMVLDNQTARIQVGDQVPITVQSSQSVTDADAPIVNSIEYRDTGVILLVTPRVNSSGLVIMELQQELSNVVEAPTQTVSEASSPTINQRQINSTIAVASGESVALGGLISDIRERLDSGIPFLSRLPVIGALFGTQSRSTVRTELLVLITPRVVENPARARAVTSELRSRLRTLRALEHRIR
ncbi:MAG: secretin N-terminal domain-containing protein [Pseudomonadota bacterium]